MESRSAWMLWFTWQSFASEALQRSPLVLRERREARSEVKRYLADTHALLWYLGARANLGRRAGRVFDDLGATTEVFVSTISLREIALLHDQGRVRLPQGYSAWCDALAAPGGIRIEPLRRDDVEQARLLGVLKDPSDRLIAGTALRIGVPLLSKDERMTRERRLRVVS